MPRSYGSDHVDWDEFRGCVVLLLAAIATSAATIWLLCRLRSCRGKLGILESQLAHLAAADLAYVVMRAIPDVFVLLSAFGFNYRLGDAFCIITHFAYTLPGTTALLLQAQLALGFAFAIFRHAAALNRLGRCLWFSWVLGVVLTVLDSFELRFYFNWGLKRQEGFCSARHQNAIVLGLTYAFTLATGLLCYVPSACRVQSAGQRVQHRVWSRATVFPIVFVCTCGPVVPGLLGYASGMLYWNVVGPVYSLNGLFNVVVYASQSRRIWNQQSRSPDHPRMPSGESMEYTSQKSSLFQVQFCEEQETRVVAECTEEDNARANSNST